MFDTQGNPLLLPMAFSCCHDFPFNMSDPGAGWATLSAPSLSFQGLFGMLFTPLRICSNASNLPACCIVFFTVFLAFSMLSCNRFLFSSSACLSSFVGDIVTCGSTCSTYFLWFLGIKPPGKSLASPPNPTRGSPEDPETYQNIQLFFRSGVLRHFVMLRCKIKCIKFYT